LFLSGQVSKKKLDGAVAAASAAALRSQSVAPSSRASRRAEKAAETVDGAAAKSKGKGKSKTKKGDGKGKSGKGKGKGKGSADRSASVQPKANLPCIFAVQGKCNNGDPCRYSHETALVTQQRKREGRCVKSGEKLTEAQIAKMKADYQKNKTKGKGKGKSKGKRVGGAVMEEIQGDGSVTYYDAEGNAVDYDYSNAEPLASAPISGTTVTDTVQSQKPTTIPAVSATSVLGFLLDPTDTAYVKPKPNY
jgi:hypothetical protein